MTTTVVDYDGALERSMVTSTPRPRGARAHPGQHWARWAGSRPALRRCDTATPGSRQARCRELPPTRRVEKDRARGPAHRRLAPRACERPDAALLEHGEGPAP